jgi:4a-hydroxytetrahydrobiopterin dehydratase
MATALTEEQRARLATDHPDWTLDETTITRTLQFADFAEAIGFVVSATLLAEAMDHHPDIDIRWNRVTLALSTHSIGTLSDLDAAFVAAVDRRL